jgi:hypothetical protein
MGEDSHDVLSVPGRQATLATRFVPPIESCRSWKGRRPSGSTAPANIDLIFHSRSVQARHGHGWAAARRQVHGLSSDPPVRAGREPPGSTAVAARPYARQTTARAPGSPTLSSRRQTWQLSERRRRSGFGVIVALIARQSAMAVRPGERGETSRRTHQLTPPAPGNPDRRGARGESNSDVRIVAKQAPRLRRPCRHDQRSSGCRCHGRCERMDCPKCSTQSAYARPPSATSPRWT